jgi:hypothetical protein
VTPEPGARSCDEVGELCEKAMIYRGFRVALG